MVMLYSPIGGWVDSPGHEIEDYLKKGWFREGTEGFVSPKTAALFRPKVEAQKPVETPVEIPVETQPDIADLRAKWEAKHGKKPHHKKSAKTLLAEL